MYKISTALLLYGNTFSPVSSGAGLRPDVGGGAAARAPHQRVRGLRPRACDTTKQHVRFRG